MKNYGFIRVAAAVPKVTVADPKTNTDEICRMISEACEKQVSLIVFPELSITGYTCGDLFGQELLIKKAEEQVARIADFSSEKSITIVVGAPVRFYSRLYNCAVVIRNGNIKGIVPKIYLPNYSEFYEARWFSSGMDFISKDVRSDNSVQQDPNGCVREGFYAVTKYAGNKCNISPNLLFAIEGATFGIEICEDVWTPIPPSSYHCLAGAHLIANLSASNETLMKHDYRKQLIQEHTHHAMSGYIYCSAGYGESTQDTVFGGSSFIYENGSLMAENERYQMASSMIIADMDVEKLINKRQRTTTFNSITPDGTRASSYGHLYSTVELGKAVETDFCRNFYRSIDRTPLVPTGPDADKHFKEITNIQTIALATRLDKIHCKNAIIGISGGLDSTLALLVTCLAFDKLGLDRKGIIGVTMPGYGTTGRTRGNAWDLMEALGVTALEIPIGEACDRHFQDIGHDKSVHDVTYENSQARERTQILMDLSNKYNGIVIGTGDLSELALGWCTYNGDHMSMYAVNAGVPKTLVKSLVSWSAKENFRDSASCGGRSSYDILMDIVDTPISPELLPADESGNIQQVTEDLVGPYELHDFFLYNMLNFGFSPEKIFFLAKKAFAEGEPVYDEETIRKWLKIFFRRFFTQQFKRSCLPDGPKIGSIGLSPRGDWKMPSDASFNAFLENI